MLKCVLERLQGRGAPGMAKAGRGPKSGGAALEGLKAFGFDKGKKKKKKTFLHFLLRAVVVCQTRALPSHIILWQCRSLVCEKAALLITQELMPLPVFRAALPSGSAILYTASYVPRNSHVPSSFSRVT